MAENVVDNAVMALLIEIRNAQKDDRREFSAFRREILERIGHLEATVTSISHRVDRIDLNFGERLDRIERRLELKESEA